MVSSDMDQFSRVNLGSKNTKSQGPPMSATIYDDKIHFKFNSWTPVATPPDLRNRTFHYSESLRKFWMVP